MNKSELNNYSTIKTNFINLRRLKTEGKVKQLPSVR
jgi:hypothetical protein